MNKERLTRKQWKWIAIGFCCMLLLLTTWACSYHYYAAPREGEEKWGIAAEHDDVTLLSAIGGSSEHPAWSPNGTQIAIQHTEARSHPADSAAARDIYVMSSTGSEELRLTSGAGNRFSCKYPSWAPAGHRLVFSCNTDGDYDLYTADVTSGILTQLTNFPGHEEYPAWSPDGEQVAFSSNMNKEEEHSKSWNLYVMMTKDKEIERLAGGFVHSPMSAWSPDSRRIAFSAQTDISSPSELCIVSLDDSGLICYSEVQCGIIAWSSSSLQMACTSGMRIINVDPLTGETQTLLSTANSNLSGLDYSPDGSKIVFSAGQSFGVANDLYVLEVQP